ncbi:MAG: response regulator [Eubacteriales bacterium]|nr:response regulator [Eubacteriales bacterium]
MELLTLLLVDDEPIILKGLLETYDWARMGFRVTGAARDGETALALIQEKQPDVVLTDVRMKKMDGLTLIEKTREAGLKTNFVVISAYRDFEYAQKACRNGALSYLVKPIEEEELEHTMAEIYEMCTEKKFKEKNYSLWEKILVEDRENFLNQMLGRYLDDGISEEEITDFFTSLSGKAELGHYFAVAAAGIDIAQQVVNQKEYDLKQYLLDTTLSKKLSEQYTVWTKRTPDGTACYIVDLGETPGEEKLKGILTGLRLEMKTDLVSALSSPEQGLSGMKKAYRQAMGLFEMASEAGAGLLTPAGHMEFGGKNQYSLDVETQILAAIRKNAKPQLKQAYEKFIYTLPGDETEARVYLRRLAVRAEFGLQESPSGMAEEMRKGFLNFYHMLEQVLLVKLIDILYQLLLSVIDQRLAMDTIPADEYFKDYIPAAIAYIREHLQEETLSITSVSESVFLNPAYFGRMFKKVMNMSFKRYVQNERLEKAKEMLLEDRESIAGICIKVGIPNPSYFSQLFKQNTGVLPSEYKRSLER